MRQEIARVALLVDDYDEAIAFYTQKLHFEVREDTALSPSKRWVLLSPPGSNGCNLLLARAVGAQREAVGRQAGGRVFLFLYTDDFARDYQNLLDQGVQIVRPAAREPYGQVAVFADLYGNQWDLIEPL